MTGNTLDLLFDLRAARGDVKAAQFVQSRHPSKTGILLDVGELDTPQDLAEAQRGIFKAVAEGTLSTQDGEKMSAQLENIGKANERHKIYRAIAELQKRIGSTQEARFNADLKKIVSALKTEIEKYLLKDEQSWDDHLKELGDNAEDFLITLQLLCYLNALCYLSFEEFIDLGHRGFLPRSVQEFFDIIKNARNSRRGDSNSKYKVSHMQRNVLQRWFPNGWACNCKNTTTLWIDSEINLVDHIRIYCDSCFKHVGWGSSEDFEQARNEGQARWLEHSETELIEKLKPKPVLEKRSLLKKRETSSVFDDDF